MCWHEPDQGGSFTAYDDRVVDVERWLMCAVGVVALGCGVERLDDGGDPQVPAEIQRILMASCGATDCHGPVRPYASLDFTTGSMSVLRSRAVSGRPYVDIGRPDNSEIAIRVSSGNMPQGMQMDPLDRWILLGWIAGGELSSEGEPLGMGCSIEEIVVADPGTVDAGTAATQIPEDVAEVITDNCGCHFGTDVIEGAIPSAFPLATLANWRGAAGTSIRDRLTREPGTSQLMPPPWACDVGDGETITPDDQQLLLDWLDAGSPSGAEWVPPS